MASRFGRSVKRRMRRVVLERMAPIARHPLASVITGLGLLFSGIVELLEDVIVGFETVIEGYHGVLLLGIVTGMRGIAELVEGIEWLSRNAEAAEEADELGTNRALIEEDAPAGQRVKDDVAV